MRVLHLACVAPPEIGGIGEVAFREVAQLRSRGMDAWLVAPEPSVSIPDESTCFVQRLPSFRFGNAAILKNLAAHLDRADLVHLHYPFYGTAERVLGGWKRKKPMIVTFHMDAQPRGWLGTIAEIHRQWMQPWLMQRASRVIVSSFDYAQRSSLAAWYADHASQVIELPFGVDTERFSPGPSQRQRFFLPDGVPVFLFVGGMDQAHAFKGIPELLEAFAHGPVDAHLMLVGEGDLRPEYEEMAKGLGIAPRTHFYGRLDPISLVDAYRSADLFVFPSTSSAEAFGLAALEAEACGLPVIASDLPGVRTVVRHGETGLLVLSRDREALANAINLLAVDRARCLLMGQQARKLAESEFSWETHIDRLMHVYALCHAEWRAAK